MCAFHSAVHASRQTVLLHVYFYFIPQGYANRTLVGYATERMPLILLCLLGVLGLILFYGNGCLILPLPEYVYHYTVP